jgi:succinyl-CoA synthetase alpha subunit
MSVVVNKSTRVICQGFTGSDGTFRSACADTVEKIVKAVRG